MTLKYYCRSASVYICSSVSVQATKSLGYRKSTKAQWNTKYAVQMIVFHLSCNVKLLTMRALSPPICLPLSHTQADHLSFCIMSCRHTLPPAFRPWGLHTAYIYRRGDLFKHMFPLTKSSMSNLALRGSTNATFSFACITLKAAGQRVLELEWKLISYIVDLPGTQ